MVRPHPRRAVLIVGAGPAGLFAACELLRHGVRPRVVERRLAPHHEARGTALQPAVLEILDRAGLIEPFLRAGVRIRHIQLLGPGLREIATRNSLISAASMSFSAACRNGAPRQSCANIWQSLGLKIEFGTEVKSIDDDPDGLRVTLETGGRTESLHDGLRAGRGRWP